MNITAYTVEKLADPFGILTGERYEFFLDIDVPEDDELYTEKGLRLKVLFVVEDSSSRITSYQFLENETEQVLDFALEEDEEEMVAAFCLDHLSEDD